MSTCMCVYVFLTVYLWGKMCTPLLKLEDEEGQMSAGSVHLKSARGHNGQLPPSLRHHGLHILIYYVSSARWP